MAAHRIEEPIKAASRPRRPAARSEAEPAASAQSPAANPAAAGIVSVETVTTPAAGDAPRRRAAPKAGARAPQKRDPERTSAAILAAAIKEFTENGYNGARINEIAARAGTNKRMIYHYFGDKEALYLAVLEGAYVAIRSAENRLHLADRAPEAAMRELARFTWNYFIEHPEFLSLLHTENLHKARHLKRSARIFNLTSPLVAVISGLLQRGAAEGVFRPDADPVKVYVTIASLGAFYLSNRFTLSTIFQRDLAERAQLESWGDHLVDVVMSYLKA